jgi:hypothetical protein
MDLSLSGQSRSAVGRRRAALSGLGPWVGARVASPRCSIFAQAVIHGSAARQLRQWPVLSGLDGAPTGLAGSSPSFLRRIELAIPLIEDRPIATGQLVLVHGALLERPPLAGGGVVVHLAFEGLQEDVEGRVAIEGEISGGVLKRNK